MALLDFLQGKEGVSEFAGGVGHRLQQPETWKPLQEEVLELLPYATTLGIDSPKLPEIARQLRQERVLKKEKVKQQQIGNIKNFYQQQGYNVAPGAEESLFKLWETTISPQEKINKAISANWVRQKPITITATKQLEQADLVKKYQELDEGALQQLFTTVTDPDDLAAIGKVARGKGIKLYSEQALAEKSEKEREKARKEEEKAKEKERKAAEKAAKVERAPLATAVKEEIALYKVDPKFVTESTKAVRQMLIDKRAGKPVGELRETRTSPLPYGGTVKLEYIPAGKTVTDMLRKEPPKVEIKEEPISIEKKEVTIVARIKTAKKQGRTIQWIRNKLIALGRDPKVYGY